MRRLALILAGAAVAALSGCGDGDDRPTHPFGAAGLPRALDLARQAGRLPMSYSLTSDRTGREGETDSAQGHLDLAGRTGDAELRLRAAKLLGLPESIRVSWTKDQVAIAGGQSRPRADVASNGGQIGKLPDQVQILAELVTDGYGVRERAPGSWTFSIRASTALERHLAPYTPRWAAVWSGEAQADANGRLRRVVLRIPSLPVGQVLAAGSVSQELKLG